MEIIAADRQLRRRLFPAFSFANGSVVLRAALRSSFAFFSSVSIAPVFLCRAADRTTFQLTAENGKKHIAASYFYFSLFFFISSFLFVRVGHRKLRAKLQKRNNVIAVNDAFSWSSEKRGLMARVSLLSMERNGFLLVDRFSMITSLR